ncbi:hypothetical protein Poli38472_004645 [Pythium oligandrum]|uniref:Protochlorophyllide reductase n=1 Tax=Pythium oligandrum TaxID=41045 RepID=A0A8K1CAV0_PYTOL|nr:hypothetical protein Poli38472_004645 [Pythium oligandrum]|eukprot:TMW59576.1 hypothetical protein Poli38472_004645 [Pythium oligandrum]
MPVASATKKVVLVTGGNSGVGFNASLTLAKTENTHVIVTGRNTERVQAAVDKIQAEAASSSVVEVGVLDLSSLKAIQEYATKLKARGLKIDALVCNAGVALTQKALTADGYEAVFGVNHLGHFYLVSLLRDVTRRVVVVTSEAHDPEEKAPVPLPNVSDLEQLAYGYEKYDPNEAYSTSKLGNLLLMNESLRRFPNGPEFLAYTPCFTPDTALLRELGDFVQTLVDGCRQNGIPVNSSPAAGGFLARLAMDDLEANGWVNGTYFRMETPRLPSVQARDAELGRAFWDKSEELAERALRA